MLYGFTFSANKIKQTNQQSFVNRVSNVKGQQFNVRIIFHVHYKKIIKYFYNVLKMCNRKTYSYNYNRTSMTPWAILPFHYICFGQIKSNFVPPNSSYTNCNRVCPLNLETQPNCSLRNWLSFYELFIEVFLRKAKEKVSQLSLHPSKSI